VVNNIFHKCAHVVLVVLEKSTTFISLLHNEECKKLNGVTWRRCVRAVNLLYQLILVKWFVLFWMCDVVALTQYCKLRSFYILCLEMNSDMKRWHWIMCGCYSQVSRRGVSRQVVYCWSSMQNWLRKTERKNSLGIFTLFNWNRSSSRHQHTRDRSTWLHLI